MCQKSQTLQSDLNATNRLPWSCPGTRSWQSPRPSPRQTPSSSPRSWCLAALQDSIQQWLEPLAVMSPADGSRMHLKRAGHCGAGVAPHRNGWAVYHRHAPLPITKGLGSFRPLTSMLRSGPLVTLPSTCAYVCKESQLESDTLLHSTTVSKRTEGKRPLCCDERNSIACLSRTANHGRRH